MTDHIEVSIMLAPIHWLGHASVKITGEKVIYIDPWELKDGDPADIILITHGHHDHCSPEDVVKIQQSGTVIVATSDCRSKLSGDVRTIAPGDSLDVDGTQIEAVHAYNIAKSFHPKSNGWVGYIITVNGTRIYHAGDTDRIPEMDGINADVALLPVGGEIHHGRPGSHHSRRSYRTRGGYSYTLRAHYWLRG